MPDYNKKIPSQFYLEDAFRVAKDYLLGAYLCSNIDGKFCAGMITELEVYIGSCDKACHAYPNKMTPRTKTMFNAGGCAYVYFVYGMYNQFNVVVGPQGEANAILIRSLEPLDGISTMSERRHCEKISSLTTGPGKLCQALGITAKEHNNINLSDNQVWLSMPDKKWDYCAVPRVGIDYAEEYKDKPWRFYIRGNKFISHP